jgi:hypothetical protein
METDAFKQKEKHMAETGCYGRDTNEGCLLVATMFEHGLGGMETEVPFRTPVPLMRKDMDNPKVFNPRGCVGWSLEQPAGCGGCFYTDDGGKTFEPYHYLYTVEKKSGKKNFLPPSHFWIAGLGSPPSEAAAYFDRCMLHVRCRLRPSCEVCAGMVTAKEEDNKRSAKRQKVDNYM